MIIWDAVSGHCPCFSFLLTMCLHFKCHSSIALLRGYNSLI